ncbi:MAG: hypothetical protein K2H41_11815 [Acetatifactor sp.]|nr:hypothetical protein [Acetatifactor sp.]MDE7114602.1 hypothetical protein [Acetatifactor sp.]
MKKIFKNKIRRFTAGILTLLILAGVLWEESATAQAVEAAGERAVQEAASAFDGDTREVSAIAAERDIMALLYLCEEYDVHREASLDSAVSDTIFSGQTVFIQDAYYNEEEEILWALVSYTNGGGNTGSGYVERQMLACSDERFLDWEQAFYRETGISGGSQSSLYAMDTRGVSADIDQFPESYQAALTALKNKHPQWIFVPMDTGLNWSTVITEELKGGKSLVHKSFPDYTKDGAYDDGNWFYATRGILEYYMDPRNGLTEDRIFQFELLTYNETYHTEAAVERFLQNTFMRSPGNAPGTVMTFAHIFWAVGAEEGREVSPFHLAARVYQEQGQGTSGLISGKYPGYEGYYNYFNVGASGTSTTQVIENGLKYAKDHGWNNAYFSILGGADVISANYIKKGQDTLYLQKYNVNPKASNALYTHQYMQNISAPTTEGSSIKRLYASADSLNNSFVFKIPVYKNMPGTACPYPSATSTEVRLQIPAGYDSTVWIDGVPYTPQNDNGTQVVKLGDDKAKSAVVYSYDAAGVPTGMYVWTLTYQSGSYTAKAQPQLKDLLSYHGFSVRISGAPGIRMKSGIATDIKTTLTQTGIDGYKLKEYGTLISDNANPAEHPLVKGGKGILTAMSYGTDAKGQKLDKVYETVDGRQRFTSVLVGLPKAQYSTTYAFRAYAVLEKNGVECVVYGPVTSRSMTALAQQILENGTYEKDSPEDIYLRKILEDAK